MTMHNTTSPDRDREIGARLREFRTQIHWSQAAFAREIELTRDQLSNIESGRTPLRYATAWRIRINFNVNLEWLAGFGGIVNDPADDGFPSPEIVPMGPRCLFDEVANLVADEKKRATNASAPIVDRDIGKREVARLVIEGYMHGWLARVPDDYVMNLANTVCAAAEELLRKCPQEPADAVAARARKLEWERVRATSAKRFIMRAQKSAVDILSNQLNSPDMVKTVDELLENVKSKTTGQHGAKTALADTLGITPQQLNDWLTQRSKPSGAHVLQLLHLGYGNRGVNNKNGPESVAAPSGPVAPKGINDEEVPKSGPGKQSPGRITKAIPPKRKPR